MQNSEGTPLKIVYTKHSEKNCPLFLSVLDEGQFYRAYSLLIDHSIIEYYPTNNGQSLLMQISVMIPNVEKNGALFFEECYSIEMNGRPFGQVFLECMRSIVEEKGKARFKEKFNVSIPDGVKFEFAKRQYLEERISSK